MGADLLAGRRDLPGGIVHQTTSWVVNHVLGPMNLGTLIVGPREHITAVADLGDTAVAELGLVLRHTARVVEALCRPEQTYVSLWSHGAAARKHLHIAVQPVTAAVVARYGGLRSEQLQPGCWQAVASQTPRPPPPGSMQARRTWPANPWHFNFRSADSC